MAGAAVTLIPGDNQPASGFAIRANVIAEITKTVPGAMPIQFAAIDSISGETRLLNNSQMISLTPTKTKGQATYIVIGKAGEHFYVT